MEAEAIGTAFGSARMFGNLARLGLAGLSLLLGVGVGYAASRDRFPYSDALPTSACAASCPSDLSPCDPHYFKMADGRCSRGHR
jgi:hypothetical protein